MSGICSAHQHHEAGCLRCEAIGCGWSIRPFPDETQLACEKGMHLPGDREHANTLRNYAFPGSATLVSWIAGDRREFSGNFPGYCTGLGSTGGRQKCTLPAGHRGQHAP